MKKHSLLLSLLAMLFAVFMTACNSGTTNDAKQQAGGGDEGAIVTPTLSFSYEYLEDYKHVKFTGSLENANAEDYTFIWDFGDKTVPVSDGLVKDYVYTVDGVYAVTLTASPKDPDNTPAIPVATGFVTISKTGIIVQAFRYSALSGMVYDFQAIATTTDGSPVLYTWDFGDGTVVENTQQNVMTHRFTKYNTEYTVKVTVKKADAGNADSVAFPEVKIKTPGLTAQMTVENDSTNPALKRMSVNFYDETGALVHGYSDGTGAVNGLDNVSYTWDFKNDGKAVETTNVGNVEYIYAEGTGTYTVKMTATSDTFTGKVETTGEANVELTYSIPTLNARLVDMYGLQLQVDVTGNGGLGFSNKEAWYEVVYPDGISQSVQVTHNADGTVSQTITRTLPSYYSNYNITINVKERELDSRILATRSITIERPSFRYVLDGPNDGGSYFTKTFSVTPAKGSFTLKNATFDWNFGEGNNPVRTTAGSASYTYQSAGEKTVTVTIDSELLRTSEISVAQPTTTFTINADITIDRILCPNAGAGQNFLQYNCRVYLTSSNNLPLYYNWYKDGKPVDGCAGPYCEHTFYKYNEGHTIKVEVGAQDLSGTPKSISADITTPNVTAVLEGPTSTIHGQNIRYSVSTKVVYEGAEKAITLDNPTYTFRIGENTSQSGSSNTWDTKFEPQGSEYGNGNTVSRTVYADVVTASNLASKVTSNSITTSVRKQDATLDSFEQPVVVCRAANDINKVRQICKMTMQAKSNIETVAGNFDQYSARFTYNNTSRTLKFKSQGLTGGAVGTTDEFTIDFNWPNYGDYTTGSNPSQSYVVGGEVYKTDDSAKKTPAQQANINITLDVDYALYPQVDSYIVISRGGSGYKFGTWSCGHNEYRGQNSVTGKPQCESNNSKTGQTLKLGLFANSDGTLKETLKFRWKLRASHFSDKGDILIREFTVDKGQTISDENLSFNLAKVLNDNGLRYTGSAYSNKHLFFLEILSDDANVLAKPLTIWYDGSGKSGYRLQKITPMLRTNGYNKCTVSVMAGSTIFGDAGATFYLSEGKILFDDMDANSGIKALLPDGNNKPWFRFSSIAYAANGTDSDWQTFNVTDTRTEDSSNSGDNRGWFFRDNTWSSGSRTVIGQVDLYSGLTSAKSYIQIVFKDMLTGGEISGYYNDEKACNISMFNVQ